MDHAQLTPRRLGKEFETFERELPNLAASEGKFVLVLGDKIIGTFGAYLDALAVGYDQCGLKPFLVKKVEAVEHDQLCP
jgi:hypothetical protein